ncbi:substrate-binding domain-containing protein [Candidatus Poribacteria bacterium]
MKKVISLLFAVLLLSACGDRSEKDRINIAIVGTARTPYWNDVELGAKAAGERLGVSVRFFAPVEENPASWQIREIGELISTPLDGLAFAAADPKSLTPVILKAMQSEIPCVAMDTDMGKSRHVYIGTGDYSAGEQAGEELVSLLESKGKIAIVASFASDIDFRKRVLGFRDALADNADMEITATIEKENNVVQTSDVEVLLGSYPDLDGIFCASDSDAIAVAEAVQQADKAGKIDIVSIGESPGLLKYVKDNVIQATVARKPYRIGYLSILVLHNMVKVGIQNALRILPESGIIDTGIVVVTPMNISEQLTELGTE